MAGGFNGDDEDYEPEEDLYEEDENLDDEDDEDEDDEEGSGNSEINPIKRKMMQIEERTLKPKLEKLELSLKTRQFAYLTYFEKKQLEKAKKHPNLKILVKKIQAEYGVLVVKTTNKVLTAASPVLMCLGYAAIFLFVISLIVAVVGAMMPWLFPDEEGGSQSSKASFGVKGSDFYGVRTIYTNDEMSRVGLLEDYSAVIEDVRENVVTYTKTITREEDDGSGGKITKTYTVTVEVKLSNLETVKDGETVEYDFKTFDEDEFSTSYNDYYKLLSDISEVVRLKDVPTGAVPATLVEKLDQIKYFGFDSSLINTAETEASNDVDDVIINYFSNSLNYNLITKDSGGVIVPGVLTADEQNEIVEELKTKATETINAIELARAEKIFIKDYILNGEDDMMQDIAEEDYIAWIFMPKKSVTFEKFSFYVTHKDVDNFDIRINGNGGEISLKEDDANFGDEEHPTYSYYITDVSVSADEFTDIDTENVEALKQGLSLAKIIRDENINKDTFLKSNSEGMYTYKSDGVYVEFTSDIKFVCVEMETIWK